AQVRLGVVALVEQLLPLPHHAEIFVVDDDHLHGKAKTVDCSQFLDVHLKSTIARDTKHTGVRLRELNADRGGQCETHGAKSAERDESARRGRSIALCGPHLVLAYIGNDHAVFRQTAEELIEKTDRRLRQSARIKLGAL